MAFSFVSGEDQTDFFQTEANDDLKVVPVANKHLAGIIYKRYYEAQRKGRKV